MKKKQRYGGRVVEKADTNRAVRKRLKGKIPALEKQYLTFFSPAPIPFCSDTENFSLEQPSLLRWVPTETTYGIDVSLCPPVNA